MKFSKLSKEQDCKHSIAVWIFLDGFKSRNRHVYIENTTDHLKNSWQAETIIHCLKFNKGSCLKLSVSFLSLILELVFRVERKQSCGNWGEMRIKERISLAPVKENTYWIIQIYYVQSSSGLVVKLGLLSEWHSLSCNKASIKQKMFPHRPPHPLPHLCFSPPNPPFPSSVEITLDSLFFCTF